MRGREGEAGVGMRGREWGVDIWWWERERVRRWEEKTEKWERGEGEEDLIVVVEE